ncbi:MAG: alkaline phosphatase [Bacteroidales bacterium]|nr:alkaline phosphatase [Bacteroidales bacterium]
MKRFVFSLLCLCVCSVVCAQSGKSTKPKYVFLFIGDGLGQVQAQIADDFVRSTRGDSLSFVQFPVKGMQTTYSLSSKITCSAAAGTALATGQKTTVGRIGLGADVKDTLKSIAYFAKDWGYKVGVLTNVPIDHATPAAFYAHTNDRNNFNEIAMQLGVSGLDFFAGGDFVQPFKGMNDAYEVMANHSFTIITDPDSVILASTMEGPIAILAENKEFAWGIEKTDKDFSLAEVTHAAIQTLENPQGFFMMIEGGKIDWACHANDAASAVHEVAEFDKAIRQAVEFYTRNPNETLILVTGDHETGGMAMGAAINPYYMNVPVLQSQHSSYASLTPLLARKIETTPLFSIDTCLQFLAQYYDVNVENGFQLHAYDSVRIKEAIQFALGKTTRMSDEEATRRYYMKADEKNNEKRASAIIITINTILAEKAGIGWTTFAHSGTRIPVYALGSGAEAFSGYYDNTDIFRKLYAHLQPPKKSIKQKSK